MNKITSIDELFAKVDAEIAAHPWRHRYRRVMHELKYTYHPRRFIEDIRCFYQRGRRGYSYRDLWSLDYYLCKVIQPAIAQLRDNAHGWPGEPLSYEDWLAILTEIEVGFEMGRRMLGFEKEPIPSLEEQEVMQELFDRGMYLFHKYFFHLWD